MNLTPHQQYKKDAEARRKEILRLSRKNMTHKDIAALVMLTPQRVGQIIAAAKEKQP
jgi:hypothetical protein